ncbi:MAG: imidazole glycerol phosphate synthase subunit HisH [Methanomassiliicoccales archaeon]
MIVIVDYQTGNVGSIHNILNKLGYNSIISSDPIVINKAKKIILPGVGAFKTGMDNLEKTGLINCLNKKIIGEKIPVLGICLGMQLMTNYSEEGESPGLGWINAKTVRFRKEEMNGKRIPNMGWNSIRIQRSHPIFNNLYGECNFYFAHSYHVVCENSMDVLATTDYGITFTSAFQHDNIIGVQFHPEKSLRWGIELLNNFAGL